MPVQEVDGSTSPQPVTLLQRPVAGRQRTLQGMIVLVGDGRDDRTDWVRSLAWQERMRPLNDGLNEEHDRTVLNECLTFILERSCPYRLYMEMAG